MANFLIYGANGYTGELIAREAVARGLRPIVAGRNRAAIGALAAELKLEQRIFALDDETLPASSLEGVSVVLHCAGPFSHTASRMADACLRSGVHYLDITGEVAVFESLAARDKEAQMAGVMLMPGVGFDVVPSDCLASHLKRRLPTACRLALGFQAMHSPSRGTANTLIENLGGDGLVRRGGELTPVPTAWKTRAIDFGAGTVTAMTIPWGDVATAWHSTGIPDIEVYMAVPGGLRLAALLSRGFGWLLRSKSLQAYFRRRVHAGAPGPSGEERARGKSLLWGEACDAAGNKVVSRLRGPDGYTFTVHTALAVVAEVLAGNVRAGFQTPAMVFGSDFVLKLAGVTRED